MKIRFIKIFIILLGIFIMSNTVLVSFGYDVKGQFSGTGTTFDSEPVVTVISTILDAVRIVGIGIALIILTYIGAKIMMASPTERANVKQYAMNYVIGAVILIGASGFLTVIKEFADKVLEVE